MTLPNVQQAVVDRDARLTRPWLKWFAELDRKLLQAGNSQSDVDAAIAAIARALGSPDGSVDNIPEREFDLQGINGVQVSGTLGDGPTYVSLRAINDSGVGAALVKITRDLYGRVQGTQSATTDDLAEGSTNKYFTDERAQDAVAAMIAAGTHTGITFTYDDANNKISASVSGGSSGINQTAASIYRKIVAWWEMDETSGTTMVDAHVNGLNGTYSGVTLNQTGLATNIGASVNFSANTSYAEVADNPLFRSARNLSCMVWIKRNGSQPGFAKILWKAASVQANGNANFMLQQDNTNNGGKASFRVTQSSNSGNIDNLTSIALADLTVYHLVGNRINDQAQIWRNGTKEGTNAAIGDLWTGGNFTLRLGNATGSDGFVGYYGQAAVFSDYLTPTEIAYLYGSGGGISYAAVKAAAGF